MSGMDVRPACGEALLPDAADPLAPAYGEFLAARRAELMERLARAVAASGREPGCVAALAVSKTVEPEAVLAARRAGWSAFAENRPQELNRKLEFAAREPELADATFDLIGNLQKNKINSVLGKPRLIHSVSSAELARAVSERACRAGLVADVLLECNVSGEESKSGFSPTEAREAAEDVAALPGIRVLGLMTMAPRGDAGRARRTFCGLRELRDDLAARTGLPLTELSAGMSDDFEAAVMEGSTIVRLGRAAFDPAYRPA